MKTRYLIYFAMALFVTSCKESQTPDLVHETSGSTNQSKEKVPPGAMSQQEYEKMIAKKLKGARTAAYTEHGPFTTPTTTETEIPGPDGRWNVWKEVFLGMPGWADGIYFCRYYEHAVMITLPPGASILPSSITAANYGYVGSAPPNPLTPSATSLYSYTYYPATNQYKLVVHTLLAKWNTLGQDINPGNWRHPAMFTNTTFTYKYFTL
ncbi:hypothetical protein GCM10023091_36700 [Ravibacter arvi]|uniref:Uncharacterized protein n=1 Tax=Ravibacter arvi TaxID=2051041 RepID=A0ABP8MAB2_9BACT